MSEFALIQRLFLNHATSDTHTELPNGDDASIHTLPEGDALVVSCDASIAGVHWPHDLDLNQAAARATQAAFSDLAAMGATPRWCWSAIQAEDETALTDMGEGVTSAIADIGAVLAGGDCVRNSTNGITLTVAGTLPSGSAMTRGSARAGDDLWLFGPVGLAAAGLRLWQRGERGHPWIEAFRDVRARIATGIALRKASVRCCIDISDGLAQDAAALAHASRVRIDIEADALPELQDLLERMPDDGLELALAGGEDYALLCCASHALRDAMIRLDGVKIGAVHHGTGVRIHHCGEPVSLPRSGYDHFS